MLKVIPRFIAFLVVLFLVPALAFAGDNDWHLSAKGDRAFFLRSVFAHGYMHGYEQGFHQGDLDLQMGHAFVRIKNQKEYKKVQGYRRDFGDHISFNEGYRKGYAVGYRDAYAGRNFRAAELIELAKSQDLRGTEAGPDGGFDQAFVSGYSLGQKMGLMDGRAAAPLANLNSIHCSGVSGKENCTAFQCGYRIGYSDGYTDQNGKRTVLARK